MDLTKFLSRKLLFTLLLLAVGFIVDLATDRGLSENLLQLLIWMGGIYVVGNGASKAIDSLKPQKEISTELDERVAKLEQNTGQIIQNVQVLNQALTQLAKR